MSNVSPYFRQGTADLTKDLPANLLKLNLHQVDDVEEDKSKSFKASKSMNLGRVGVMKMASYVASDHILADDESNNDDRCST